MGSNMDFIGNQWLVVQYQKSADPQSRGRVLYDLVSSLMTDGLSMDEACQEVRDCLKGDAHVDVALSSVIARPAFG